MQLTELLFFGPALLPASVDPRRAGFLRGGGEPSAAFEVLPLTVGREQSGQEQMMLPLRVSAGLILSELCRDL